MRNTILFIATGLLLSACSPKIQESIKTVTETIRDTTIIVKPDSSFYQAWIDCRNGKPVLIKKDTVFVERQGGYIQIPKIKLKGNILQVQSIANKQEIKAQLKDRTTTEVKTVVREVEKELNWWQQLFLWSGALFWGLIVFYVGFRIYFWRISFFKRLL